MAKKQKEKPQTISINDVEYNVNDLTQEQIIMVNHVQDLDRKLSSAQFNIDQLKESPTQSLKNPTEWRRKAK